MHTPLQKNLSEVSSRAKPTTDFLKESVLGAVKAAEPSPICSPSLLTAGGCRQKGGPGSWRCVRGPAQCKAAGGRSGLTGSADRLQRGPERKDTIYNAYG